MPLSMPSGMKSHSLSWSATGGPGRCTRKTAHAVIAGAHSREAARASLARLHPAGGTAIGKCGDYPTGAWGTESRDYHLCVEVEPGAVGQEMLAARVSLILNTAQGPRTLGQGLVRAIWTGDEALSTRISRHVAHYTGQAELAQAIQDGLEARKAGDDSTAAARLGQAVALAHESGNQDTADLLAKVVDVIDPATGTIRLKAKVADADEMALDTRSTKTVRARK